MAGNGTLLKKGAEIFAAKPFVYTLSSNHIDNRCDNCLKSSEKLSKCSGCDYVSYCNRNCQKESWKIHKVECPNLKRMGPKVLTDSARLMARIIIKLNQGGHNERDFYSETSFRKFKDLMSHYPNIKKHEKRMEHFVCLCALIYDFLRDVTIPNTSELMGIYGRICTNSFNILDNDMNSIGVGIYLGPSIMDHSCKANAVVIFEGTTIIIRAIEDIPCLDWSLVRMSYIDVLKSTSERMDELQKFYYFQCDCERCKCPPAEENAAACQNTSCSFPCDSSISNCPECGAKFASNFANTFKEVTEFTAHHLQTMKDMAYLDVSKLCLKKQEGVLHPFNVLHVRTIETAFTAASKLQYWNDAEFYADKLVPGYKMYYGLVHPLTGIHYLAIGKIKLLLEKPKEALVALRIAGEILAVTHGEKHSLVREVLKPFLLQAMMETRE